jgi:predicted MPP superfamily phosphohydrolase
VTLGFAVWALLLEPGWGVTRQTRVPITRWPDDLGLLRIAALADLPAGSPHITVNKVREIVQSVNAARPDLIVLPGDSVIHGAVGGRFVHIEPIAPVLRDLQAPLGVFAVLGNRDSSRFGERYAIGHVHADGRDLFVSPGIGTSIVPVRFRVPPEISVLTVGR